MRAEVQHCIADHQTDKCLVCFGRRVALMVHEKCRLCPYIGATCAMGITLNEATPCSISASGPINLLDQIDHLVGWMSLGDFGEFVEWIEANIDFLLDAFAVHKDGEAKRPGALRPPFYRRKIGRVPDLTADFRDGGWMGELPL